MDYHTTLSRTNVAVITGATSGIGPAAATKYAFLGTRVFKADFNAALLEAASAREYALTAVAISGPWWCMSRNLPGWNNSGAPGHAVFGWVEVLMNNAGLGIRAAPAHYGITI